MPDRTQAAMHRPFRRRRMWIWTGAVVGTVLVLLAVIPFFVDLDRYRDRWLPLVESAVGRRVEVGHVELTLLTGLGARIDGLIVHDDPRFGADPLLAADSVRARIKLIPLLRGRVAIKEIRLDRPVLRVVKNEAGAVNLASWPTAPPADQSSDVPPVAGAGLAALSLADFSIRDGSVSYEDRSAPSDPRRHALDHIEASLRNVGVGETLAVDLAARLAEADAPVVIEGTAGPLDDGGRPQAFNFSAGVGESRVTITGASGPAGLSVEARSDRLDMAQLSRIVRGMVPAFPADLTASGQGDFALTMKPQPDGYEVDGRLALDGARVTYASFFDKPERTPMGLTFSGRVRPTDSGVAIALPAVAIRLHTLEAKGRADAAIGKAFASHGEIDTGDADLAGWQGLAPMLRGGNVSGRARIEASWSLDAGRPPAYRVALRVRDAQATMPGRPQPVTRLGGSMVIEGERLTISRMAINAGGSDLEVNGAIAGLARPTGTLALSSRLLDLSELMPPVAPPSSPPPAAAAKPSAAAPQSPAATAPGPLRDASIRLNVIASRVRGPSIPEVTDLKGAMRWTRGVLEISRVTGRVYDGGMLISGRIAPFAPEPTFTLEATADKLEVKDALAQYTSLGDFLVGRLSGRLGVSGAGSTWAEVAPTLTGKGDLAVTDGALRTFNVIKDVLATANALGVSRLTERPDTPFQRLSAAVEIRNGVIHLEQARLAGGEYGADASGTVGLDAAVDLKATLTIPRSAAGGLAQSALGAALSDGEGRLQVPITLTGRLPKPKVGVDRASALDEAGRRLRQRGTEKLREFLDQAEQDGAESPRDLLKGLLKR